MDEIEIGVLEACQEYISRQHETLPKLAAALGVEPAQVFYTWALRRCTQPGRLAEADWTYFFHGLECDLRIQKDGRFLRIDFGPKGRVGILNDGGVLRFIMTSVPPWREFPKLRAYLAKSGPPFNEYSGAWDRMSEAWGRLTSKGFFEPVDPTLMELKAEYTTGRADGVTYLLYPPEITDERRADLSVAFRPVLSQKAVHFLKTNPLSGTLGDQSNDGQSRAVVAS